MWRWQTKNVFRMELDKPPENFSSKYYYNASYFVQIAFLYVIYTTDILYVMKDRALLAHFYFHAVLTPFAEGSNTFWCILGHFSLLVHIEAWDQTWIFSFPSIQLSIWARQPLDFWGCRLHVCCGKLCSVNICLGMGIKLKDKLFWNNLKKMSFLNTYLE